MTEEPDRWLVPLESVSDTDRPWVGGKASKLGELVREGLPIPPGFVVTTTAFDAFVNSSGLSGRIASLLNGLDDGEGARVEEASRSIRTAFLETPYPAALENRIRESFRGFAKEKSSDLLRGSLLRDGGGF
ncbi:Pyruvate phosphate dikinase, PEP/pyruvate-binding domain protein, partial [mine drainage metagenome]